MNKPVDEKELFARLKTAERILDMEQTLLNQYQEISLLLILPETDCEDALACSERLRQEVSSLRFSSESGPFGITASFGIVTVQGSPNRVYPDMDVLLKATDDNLYRAKEQGRNLSVCSHI